MEKTVRHHHMILTYEVGEKSANMKKFMPGENKNGFGGHFLLPNFSLSVAGYDYGLQEGVNSGGSCIPWQSECTGCEFNEKGGVLTYVHQDLKLKVEVHMEFIPGADVIRQYNRVTNIGAEDVVLTQIGRAHV